MDLIFSHYWPGNVRELENAVERAMVLAKGEHIIPDNLPAQLRLQEPLIRDSERMANLDKVERDHVLSVLEECHWNKFMAAKMMGISRSTLYSKIKKHGLRKSG